MMSILSVDEFQSLEARDRKRHGRATLIDLSIIAGGVTSFFLLAADLELAEQLAHWARRYEHWQLDELPLTLMLLSVGLAWFGWRRLRELRLEVNARCRVEELNLRMLAQNRQLAQQLIQLQEQERRHLARELHDEFGQCCVAIKVDATLIAQDTVDKHSPIHTSARAIFDTADHLHDVLRSMLHRLRPAGLDDLGLITCLQVLVESWSRRHAVICTFTTDGLFEGLDEATNITLYRAVQESLSNIAQHAHASRASVMICRSAPSPDTQSITLNIHDNGVGLSKDTRRQGLGVLGMNERVSALGGCLSLSMGPSGGTHVRVVLPMSIEGATA
jgi:glucose-6-phosphate-specific signal transduction histidine kinase